MFNAGLTGCFTGSRGSNSASPRPLSDFLRAELLRILPPPAGLGLLLRFDGPNRRLRAGGALLAEELFQPLLAVALVLLERVRAGVPTDPYDHDHAFHVRSLINW